MTGVQTCALPISSEFIKPDYHWIDVFVKYGTFVASMALAENSDEVAAILQTSTLPSGSTLRKSKGVNVMINSYFSFIYSNYYNKNGDYGNLKDGFEISAPVGLSINFGAHKNNRRKDGKRTIVNNWQIFGSLIDVGTLANVRLVDNQTHVPKFTLENIFAPGLTINMGGLFNSPLTLGAGFQRAPNVLLINGVATKQPTSLRFSLNLSWDIPMWSLKHWD